jgi:hypothetical protein
MGGGAGNAKGFLKSNSQGLDTGNVTPGEVRAVERKFRNRSFSKKLIVMGSEAAADSGLF